MQFPIQIKFKLLALAPQIYVTDSAGQTIGYVRQKLLALKEAVTVFTDETQAKSIYSIAADRIIDFNAEYHIANAAGDRLASVQRFGARSLWKAHYVVKLRGQPLFDVNEESAMVKFIDGLIGEIPVIGMLTGYFLNPKYLISRSGGGQPALTMIKHRSFLESMFEIQKHTELSSDEQEAIMLALMMIVLLERSRG